MEGKELVALAQEAMRNAYVPYSGFQVGAAVFTASGRVYTGCNIENASYGLSICAERTAIFQAVSAGEREIESIAIISSGKEMVTPCGACRQVMAEFNPNLTLYLADGAGNYKEFTLPQLLPEMFVLKKSADEVQK